jgi:glutathione peroxidase
MRNSIGWIVAVAALIVVVPVLAADRKTNVKKAKKGDSVPPALNFTMKSLEGEDVDLSQYKGQVVLMVNVASYCGNTKQYTPLEALHKELGDKGLAILGFPANEFGAQEPGSDEDIAEFCSKEYGVTFPMFSKIVVKGDGQHPLYTYLTSEETNPQFAGDVTWNFEKFLIGRNGEVVARFKPGLSPDAPEVRQAIETELAKK